MHERNENKSEKKESAASLASRKQQNKHKMEKVLGLKQGNVENSRKTIVNQNHVS